MESTPPAWVRVGRVLSALGLRGQVRIEPLTWAIDRFHPGLEVRLNRATLTLSEVIDSGNSLILTFAEITSRPEAEKLRGAYLEVPAGDSLSLPSGSYYHFQLIGLTVLNGEGDEIGKVAEVLVNPANDVLRVEGEREYLVPMVRDAVASIDLERATVRALDWVEVVQGKRPSRPERRARKPKPLRNRKGPGSQPPAAAVPAPAPRSESPD